MNFKRLGSDEHSTLRVAPFDGRERDSDDIPVGKGQFIDGDLPGTDLLEGHLAIRTAQLATTVTEALRLAPRLFPQEP